MDIIKLPNKCNQHNYLKKIKGTTNEYKLVIDSIYIRCMILKDNKYAIDLGGSSVICEGKLLEGTNYKVNKIIAIPKNGYKIILE